MLVMDPSTYTVDIVGFVYTNDPGRGVKGTFDALGDQLSIVAIPME